MTITGRPSMPRSPAEADVSGKSVWREAGCFVRQTGSEAIFAFEPIETETLIAAFEWNEVAVFRKIRGFMHSLDDAVVTSTNRSLYLFIATLLANALSA